MRAASFNDSRGDDKWDEETAPNQLKIACDRFDEVEAYITEYENRMPPGAESRLNLLGDWDSPVEAISTIRELLSSSTVRNSPTLSIAALAKLPKYLGKLRNSVTQALSDGGAVAELLSELEDAIDSLIASFRDRPENDISILRTAAYLVRSQLAVHRRDWSHAKGAVASAVVGLLSVLGDAQAPGDGSFMLLLGHFSLLGECFAGEGDVMCGIFYCKLLVRYVTQVLTGSALCQGASDAEVLEMANNLSDNLDIVRYLNQSGRVGEALFFALNFGEVTVDAARTPAESRLYVPMTPAETACLEVLRKWLDWSEGPRTEDDFRKVLITIRDTLEASKAEADPLNRQILSDMVRKLPLDPSTAFLHYQSLVDSLEIFVVLDGRLFSTEVAVTNQALSEQLGKLLALYENPTTDARAELQWNRTYEHLIAPVLDTLNDGRISRLLISTTGVLRYVPFSALYDGDQFLLERYACVNYSPYMRFDGREPSNGSRKAYLFGRARSSAAHRLPALPSVLQELRDVRAALESAGVSVSVLCDDTPGCSFSLDSLRRALAENPEFLHFSSHYVGDPADSSRGKLLLGDDTLLGNRELEEMVVQGTPIEMAVVCCCSSGTPIPGIRGETDADLTSILLRKGVRTVVSALWPLQSEAAAVLISSYYKKVFSDPALSRDEALRRAQLHFLLEADGSGTKAPGTTAAVRGFGRSIPETDQWSHPYHWAPFTITGDWRPVCGW
jgi:CHAT domain-containing protein